MKRHHYHHIPSHSGHLSAMPGNAWLAVLACCALLLFTRPAFAQQGNGAGGATNEFNFGIRITFGVRGQKPLIWDGQATIDSGRVQGIRGIGFDDGDELFPPQNRWRCSIGRMRGREYAQALGVEGPVREFLQEIMAKGVEFDILAPRDASVTLSTAAGHFSFSLSDLVMGRRVEFLQGNLTAELVPRPHAIPGTGDIQNYPGITAAPEGSVWLAWVSFEKGKESLLIARHTPEGWGDPEELDNGKEGFLNPALACLPGGDLWVVWPGKVKKNWDLYARYFSQKKQAWSGITRLTTENGPDVYPVIAADASGRAYLCWQGFRNGNDDVLMRIIENGRWGKTIAVTDHPGNDWEPAIAVNARGTLTIAWEGFRDGLHQILAREWSEGALTPIRVITSAQSAVAHATVTSDLNGRFWVAWDAAGSDWGFGEEEEERTIGVFKFDELTTQIDYDKVAITGRRGRYNSRTLGLVCLAEEGIYLPALNPFDHVPAPVKMYADNPRLLTDRQGRLWLIFQHYVGKIPFYVHGQLMEVWKVYAMFYDGLRWSDPISMPHNTWRQFCGPSVCIAPGGHLWTAYTQDDRELGNRDINPPTLSVSSFALPAGDRANLPVIPLPDEYLQQASAGYGPGNVSWESYRTTLGTPQYTLYWGSLHDLHDVRGRMYLDGFVIDSFKYALDDWGYDFIGLKDYAFRNEQWFTNENYAWWETQKVIDLFSVEGEFLSFFLPAKSPYIRPMGHGLLKKRPPKGVPIIMGVYAEDLTEGAVVDAIEKRRQYLATDKILLDFWVAGHPMGDKFKCADRFPKMEALVVGTGTLSRVDIIRNADCVYSSQPNSSSFRFTFVDTGLDPGVAGEYHYFLQAEQENGRMAWSPPTCLHYFPGYDTK